MLWGATVPRNNPTTVFRAIQMCIIIYCVTFTDDSVAANDRCRIVLTTQSFAFKVFTIIQSKSFVCFMEYLLQV